MRFSDLQSANMERLATAWPTEDPWAPWDWTNAMVGEVGEACADALSLLSLLAAVTAKAGSAANITKKMNRVWPAGMSPSAWNKPEDERIDELTQRLGDEVADVVIYADLLMSKLGLNLDDAVRRKFNRKSDEIRSSVKL